MQLNVGDLSKVLNAAVMSKPQQWRPDRRVYVAIPCYSQKTDIRVYQSLLGSIQECAAAGIGVQFGWRPGDSLVHKARNVLAGEFLAGDYTDLFWVDDDIFWGPDTFVRMLMHPVDLVAGCYRMKTPDVNYFVRPLVGDEFIRDPMTRLVEIKSVPTGFMRCKRAVFESIIADMDPTKDQFKDHAAPHLPRMWQFFDFKFGPGDPGPNPDNINVLWGEDYCFCERYRKAGGHVWIDPDIVLHHIGTTTFSGRFADHMDPFMAHKGIKPENELRLMVEEAEVARRQADMGRQIVANVNLVALAA